MTKKKRVRLTHDDRKKLILKVAVSLATEVGYTNVTSRVIASRCNINHGLIFYYFESMEKLKALIMQTAIEQEVLNIILQGICISDPVALEAPWALQDKARRG